MDPLAVLLVIGAMVAVVLADGVCDNVRPGPPSFLADPDDCRAFHICLGKRSWMFTCGSKTDGVGKVFDPATRTCVLKGSEHDNSACNADLYRKPLLKPKTYCRPGQKTDFADESNCARYYKCSGSGYHPVSGECVYPKLFDRVSSKCQLYLFVKCDLRPEPKDPCDYQSNQCRESQCVACRSRFGTCIGLKDGPNAWVGKLWTPHFVVCKDQRVLLHADCRSNGQLQLFNPSTRRCSSVRSMLRRALLLTAMRRKRV